LEGLGRSLTDEPIVRLILDGTVVRVRLDRKATSISLLVVLGVRTDGQKVLLVVKAVGGETKEGWQAVLDDLVKRGLRKPEFLIVDGGSGLEIHQSADCLGWRNLRPLAVAPRLGALKPPLSPRAVSPFDTSTICATEENHSTWLKA
jgi:Transposase, Mutator family